MNNRQIKRTQLYKLQALQREAFDHGLNMEIHTRAAGSGEPWITGYLSEEGSNLVEDAEGTTYLWFHFYEAWEFSTAAENLENWAKEFNKIQAFIAKRQ